MLAENPGTAIIISMVFLIIITIAEFNIIRHGRGHYEFRSSILKFKTYSWEAENAINNFTVSYFIPVFKFVAYCLLCYGLYFLTQSLVVNKTLATLFIMLHIVLICISFLLDCICRVNWLKRIFYKAHGSSLFVLKKVIPIVFLLAYVIALPQIFYSIPN